MKPSETFTNEQIYEYFLWKQGNTPHDIVSPKPFKISDKRTKKLIDSYNKWFADLTEEERERKIKRELRKETHNYVNMLLRNCYDNQTIFYNDKDIDPIFHPNMVYVKTSIMLIHYGTSFYGEWFPDTLTKKELKQAKEEINLKLYNHLSDTISHFDQYFVK